MELDVAETMEEELGGIAGGGGGGGVGVKRRSNQ